MPSLSKEPIDQIDITGGTNATGCLRFSLNPGVDPDPSAQYHDIAINALHPRGALPQVEPIRAQRVRVLGRNPNEAFDGISYHGQKGAKTVPLTSAHGTHVVLPARFGSTDVASGRLENVNGNAVVVDVARLLEIGERAITKEVVERIQLTLTDAGELQKPHIVLLKVLPQKDETSESQLLSYPGFDRVESFDAFVEKISTAVKGRLTGIYIGAPTPELVDGQLSNEQMREARNGIYRHAHLRRIAMVNNCNLAGYLHGELAYVKPLANPGTAPAFHDAIPLVSALAVRRSSIDDFLTRNGMTFAMNAKIAAYAKKLAEADRKKAQAAARGKK